MRNSTHGTNRGPRRAISRIAPAVALTLIGLIHFGGCATQPAANVQRQQAVTLSLALTDRDHRLDSLQTPAVMEYAGPGGHIKAREQIIVRRPASLRVEAMSPLGVALVVAADGGQIAVFDPSKNILMRGPASAATLDRFTRIPMAPQQAVRLLLALSPDSAILAFAPSAIRDEGPLKVLSYARSNGVIDELGFADRNLMVAREKTSAGQLIYEVNYKDYRDIGGIDFPYQLDARFPRAGTTIKFRYEKPIVDGEVADSRFVLSPGPKTRQINLGLNDDFGLGNSNG